MTGLNNSDIIAELTPHRWAEPELTVARRAFECALVGNYSPMDEHTERLRAEHPRAYADLCYALAVWHPKVESLSGPKPMPPYEPPIRHDSIKVPCGRCGHDEKQHESGAPYGFVGRMCHDCHAAVCAPVKVPVGVEGWSIEGRAK